MIEKWEFINGYEGLYEVSNFGRVRSHRAGKIKVLKPLYVRENRPDKKITAIQFALHKKGLKVKYKKAHHLVLEQFTGSCPDGMEGCHFDGNPTNNCIDNLRWDTKKNNGLDKSRLGRVRGSANPSAKLNETDVKEIKRLFSKNKNTDIAEKYNVSPVTISHIRRGRCWRHVCEY